MFNHHTEGVNSGIQQSGRWDRFEQSLPPVLQLLDGTCTAHGPDAPAGAGAGKSCTTAAINGCPDQFLAGRIQDLRGHPPSDGGLLVHPIDGTGQILFDKGLCKPLRAADDLDPLLTILSG